jgi:hypothetical protein
MRAFAGILVAAAAAYIAWPTVPAAATPWQSQRFSVPPASCGNGCNKDPFPLGQGDDHAFVVLNAPASLTQNGLGAACAPHPQCELNPARAWLIPDQHIVVIWMRSRTGTTPLQTWAEGQQ